MLHNVFILSCELKKVIYSRFSSPEFKGLYKKVEIYVQSFTNSALNRPRSLKFMFMLCMYACRPMYIININNNKNNKGYFLKKHRSRDWKTSMSVKEFA